MFKPTFIFSYSFCRLYLRCVDLKWLAKKMGKKSSAVLIWSEDSVIRRGKGEFECKYCCSWKNETPQISSLMIGWNRKKRTTEYGIALEMDFYEYDSIDWRYRPDLQYILTVHYYRRQRFSMVYNHYSS